MLTQVMQRMLCDHGVFPSEILKLPRREIMVIHALLTKESREIKAATHRGK
jgi:hypothetical protein